MNNKKSFFGIAKLCCLILGLSNVGIAQENSGLSVVAGDFISYIDGNNGRFSLLNTQQTNSNLISLLFGGVSVPSSQIMIYYDGELIGLDQMTPVYPLGSSVGSQVDGIFYIENKLQVEVAYFPMDILANSDMSTLGVAIKISNMTSSVIDNIGIKVVLDPDVGENENDPLVYLPSGEKITNAFVLDRENMPPYLFFGDKYTASREAKGEGFYLYPFLSSTIPSFLSIANWRRISDEKWAELVIEPSLSYRSDSSKDVGVAIFYGPYSITPEAPLSGGFAISRNFTSLWPIVDENVISKGVFYKDRFRIEEILKTFPMPKNKSLSQETRYSESIIRVDDRQLYRQRLLGLVPLKSSTNKDYNDLLDKVKLRGSVWDNVYELNLELLRIDQNINKSLQKNIKEDVFESPPDKGIIKTNFQK